MGRLLNINVLVASNKMTIHLLNRQCISAFMLRMVAFAFVIACISGCRESPSGGPYNGEHSDASPAAAKTKASTDLVPPASGDGKQSETTQASKTEQLECYPNAMSHPSIVQILAHPDRYHGRTVLVQGYLRVEFEGTAIYLSKEDADYGMTCNAFSVVLSKKSAKYDRKHVLLEGRFDKNCRGHYGMFQGTIDHITRVVELTKYD